MNELSLQLQRLLGEQIGLLNNEAISSCANRQGLRKQSGELLEAAFLDLATRLAPTLSVEIGAHEASFSERLKTNLPNLQALAFEANPFVYRRHVDRLRNLSVDYRHAAICSEDGTVPLQIPVKRNGDLFGRDHGIASLYRRVGEGFEYERVLVPAITLDTALRQFLGVRSVVWIDAEGAQHTIMAGGRSYFAGVMALYIEVERRAAWCDQKLDREIATRLADFSLVPIMRDGLAKGQYNEVYVRMDGEVGNVAFAATLSYTEQLRALISANESG
jgi:FkbM family methyltransferase